MVVENILLRYRSNLIVSLSLILLGITLALFISMEINSVLGTKWSLNFKVRQYCWVAVRE